ncbi:hypothetical protein PMIN06_003983 [Paraphaeosphaeria minitans]
MSPPTPRRHGLPSTFTLMWEPVQPLRYASSIYFSSYTRQKWTCTYGLSQPCLRSRSFLLSSRTGSCHFRPFLAIVKQDHPYVFNAVYSVSFLKRVISELVSACFRTAVATCMVAAAFRLLFTRLLGNARHEPTRRSVPHVHLAAPNYCRALHLPLTHTSL